MYNASLNVISLLVHRIKELKPSWNNYALISVNRAAIWHKLNIQNNADLLHYLKLLNLSTAQALDSILLTIQPDFLPWCVAILLTDPQLMDVLQFNNTDNILCYLANKKLLCEILNNYPNIIKNMLSGKNLPDDLIVRLQAMFLGADLEANALGVARDCKNLEFLVFLLKEIIVLFPQILKDVNKNFQLTDVFVELNASIDISKALESLKACTNIIDPNVDWSFIAYINDLLHGINLAHSYLEPTVIFSRKHSVNSNTVSTEDEINSKSSVGRRIYV
jgi:hypothetical protein